MRMLTISALPVNISRCMSNGVEGVFCGIGLRLNGQGVEKSARIGVGAWGYSPKCVGGVFSEVRRAPVLCR